MMKNLVGFVFGNEFLDTIPKEWFKKEKIKLIWTFLELNVVFYERRSDENEMMCHDSKYFQINV